MKASDFINQLLDSLAEHGAQVAHSIADVRDLDAWAFALGQFGREAVPALIHQARGKNRGLRMIALQALGWMRPEEVTEAIPVIVQILEQVSNDSIRATAEWALCKLKADGVLPEMIRILKTGPRCAKPWAATVCAAYGSAALEAFPIIRDLLLDCQPAAADEYERALRKIAPDQVS